MYKNNSYNYREELNQSIKVNWDNIEKLKIKVAKMACFDLEMGTMWLIGKPSVAWYCIGKMFLIF